ncbi:MAG: sugar ABC transporter ATP-binding protein [Verrucomicrobia bacterium]|nr:sugar ABC transporter ATP-binding protein [Verrucomicrobiota bacterium]
MPAPLLELRQITKSFGGARALRGVDFDLRAGEIHALLGENGAGKSTLIKVITGAHAADAGTLALEGAPLRHHQPASAHAAGIACIYQQPALFPDLTVAENIALRLESGSPWRRVDWRDRHAQASRWLTRLGAHIDPGTEAGELSMPEQQLVEIACALGAGARVLLMDEPTASLTPREQEKLFSLIRDLRQTGVGIIYISHRLEEIFALADRVTVLRDGASVGTRSISDVTESELIRMMVGRDLTSAPAPAEARPGGAVLVLRGVGCSATGVRDVSLELRAGEVFGVAGLVGAGRTELARVLFGLTPADAGEILLDGREVSIRSPRQAMALGLAYVPEDRRRHGAILELPVSHNLTLASHARVFPRGWLRPQAERELARRFITQLSVRCSSPEETTGALSGGNQQKIALARWLATCPRVLLLDEPTQGVDVGAKSEIHGLIRDLTRQGIAVLLISSDLSEILALSDRIGVMRGGTLPAILPGRSTAAEVMAAALGQEEKRAP